MDEYVEEELYDVDYWREVWLDEQAEAMIDYAYEDEDYDYNPEVV